MREKPTRREHNARANGYYQCDLLTPMGAIEDLQVPRMRIADFHPFFLEPHERHLFKLEELVSAIYAGGLSTRDISRTLGALLRRKYSPTRVSAITQKALEKAGAFRKRKIEKWFPAYVDGTFLKVRREGIVGEEVVYLALGINEEGLKEVLTFFPASSGIKYFVIPGDGAPWVKERMEYFSPSIYQLDRFHLRRAITKVVREKRLRRSTPS